MTFYVRSEMADGTRLPNGRHHEEEDWPMVPRVGDCIEFFSGSAWVSEVVFAVQDRTIVTVYLKRTRE
jgi:hypothetical protein